MLYVGSLENETLKTNKLFNLVFEGENPSTQRYYESSLSCQFLG